MPVQLSYEVKVDTLRNNTFGGTYDDISAYVVGFTSSAGILSGQSAGDIDNLIASPAYLTMKLDNKSGVFNQETLGSEVVNNNTFATWSVGNPSSWTVTGEVGTNPEISQVDMSALHGGTGTGACNIYSTSATVSISQTTLTSGITYRCIITVSRVGAGVIDVYNGSTRVATFGEEGVFTFYFTATSTTLKIQNRTASCDVTLNDISCKAVARYGGLLAPGVIVRVRATYGTTATLYLGKITEGGVKFGVNPKAGSVDGMAVNLTIQDAMKELLDAEYAPPLQTNVTTGAVIQKMFDNVVILWPYTSSTWMIGTSGASELDSTTYLAPSPNLTADTGLTTFTFAGDVANKGGKGVSAQQYLRDVLMAEAGGRFYWQPRSGTWIFHSRSKDMLNSTISATITETQCTEMDYVYGDDITNKVTINYTVRKQGGEGIVLYTLQNVPVRINANSVRKFTGKYTNPDGADNKHIGGTNFQNLTWITDYLVSTNEDGTGVASSYSVMANPSATSVEIIVDNQSARDIYLTYLQFRGKPLIWYDESVTEHDAHSMRKFDIRIDKPINIKMIDEPNFAQAVAQFLISKYKNPIARVNSLSFIANDSATLAGHVINRTIGDRITVTNSAVNHNADYIIIGETHDYSAEARTHKTSWFLRPVSREAFWQLDTVGKAELNTNTILSL